MKAEKQNLKLKIIFSIIAIVIIIILIVINYKGKILNTNINMGDNMKLYIKVNDKTLTATLENNSSVEALIEKLAQDDVMIHMEDYGNFEKVGLLGFSLPRNDKQITTTAGDIILYQGNSITIYYDTNSWDFTKLGHIDITQEELKQILGPKDVDVTLTLKQ